MSAHAQLRSLERLVMPGPVASAHAETEADCSSCHVRFDRASQRDLCLGCHEEIAADLARAEGFHGRSPQVAGTEQCATCHTDHKGRDADILALDAASFDHGLTDFALRGAHAEAECEGCHAPDATFHAAETECAACHIDDDRHQGNLGEQCADCHVETEWAEARFDHAAVTGYALTGAHAGAACAACHVDEQYAATSDRCIACHRADDVHSGTNGSECASCHGTADWAEVRFDHFDASGF